MRQQPPAPTSRAALHQCGYTTQCVHLPRPPAPSPCVSCRLHPPLACFALPWQPSGCKRRYGRVACASQLPVPPSRTSLPLFLTCTRRIFLSLLLLKPAGSLMSPQPSQCRVSPLSLPGWPAVLRIASLDCHPARPCRVMSFLLRLAGWPWCVTSIPPLTVMQHIWPPSLPPSLAALRMPSFPFFFLFLADRLQRPDGAGISRLSEPRRR